MILDTLNTFLGFVGIMLVLSLMVTAIVQFVQSIFQMRARNLRVGLESLIEKLQTEQPKGRSDGNARLQPSNENEAADTRHSNPPGAEGPAKDPKRIADDLVRKCRFVPKSKRAAGSMKAELASQLKGPPCSWISREELIERLADENLVSRSKGNIGAKGLLSDVDQTDEKRISVQFQRMEAYLNKRFLLYIRVITIVCAVLVAGYFQVSTPELLKKLSSDKRFREVAAKTSEQLYSEADALIKASTNYQNVSEMALDKLTAKHPNHAAYLERASGLGDSRTDIVGELQTVLSPLPPSERSKIIDDYEMLLDGLQNEASEASVKQVGYLADKLTAYDITPWAYGFKYYGNPANVVGVLMTAIFLAFGAPFWYERLRDLIQLRDALKPKQQKPTDSPDN